MNRLGLVQVKDTDFVDLTKWWLDLTLKMDKLADFDHFSANHKTTTEMTSVGGLSQITVKVMSDSNAVLATRLVREVSAGTYEITTTLDGTTEKWRVQLTGDTVKKERIS